MDDTSMQIDVEACNLKWEVGITVFAAVFYSQSK